MTRTKMSIALMLALTTIPAYAAQDNVYHHEVEIGFLDSSGEADGLVNANYRYYFKAVEQADKPYELAAFFNQGSTISGRYATTDLKDLYNISGQYVYDSNWFVGAGVNRYNFDNNGNYRGIDSNIIYDVNLGYFLPTTLH
ncbi:putative porin [Shewanella sp. H8]|uniref:putative porin n=1 Tax=Shewanella sp. H8 TaxID=3342676 RepID=UPI00331621D3